jgi:hypothetical protein
MVYNLTISEHENKHPSTRSPFGVNDDGTPIYEILRLLYGDININDKNNKKIIKLTDNHLRMNFKRPISPEIITKHVFDDDYSVADFGNFLRDTTPNNKKIVSRIKDEMVLCLIAKKQQRYTESFLYIYRILESISVIIPFLYASGYRDYTKSFSFLNSMLKNDRDKELAILNNAVGLIAKQGGLDGMSFNDFGSEFEERLTRKLLAEIERCIKPKVKEIDIDELKLDVPFCAMPRFIVAVRNRMFHYTLGGNNFDLSVVGGSENICKFLIADILYWFSLIFIEIVRRSASIKR